MKAIGKILAVADPTHRTDPGAQRAVERGFALARVLNAELRLLVVGDHNEYLKRWRSPEPPDQQRARREYIARKRAWLQEVASSVGTGSTPVTLAVVADGPLHEGISRQALRYKPDLVIKDTHHHSALSRALFTNTDWHLIRECPAPLMLVRTEGWPRTGRILAAVDPLNEHDKPAALDCKILDTASNFAGATGSELHALHVFEPMEAMVSTVDGYVPIVLPTEEINAKLRTQHGQALRSLVAGLDLPADRVQLRSGAVRDQLTAVARELGATLIVMGAIARSGLKRVFIGSTAEQVLESLPCDVLIVKPDGFECPVELYQQEPLLEDIAVARA
jgi:universal stress protein E